MEIILSGDRIDAAHAYRIGLVNRVWKQSELLEKSLDYAQMLARRAPLAHRFAKATMRRMIGMPLAEALRNEVRSFYDLGQSEDLKEGTQSFRERRFAAFKAK
jgi:enoyl-CoA hydratase/carnithine racemase